MEELRREWGKNVALWRNVKGWSQARLAHEVDVTQQTISSIESGSSAPRDDLKVRLATVLERDVRDLFPLTRNVTAR